MQGSRSHKIPWLRMQVSDNDAGCVSCSDGGCGDGDYASLVHYHTRSLIRLCSFPQNRCLQTHPSVCHHRFRNAEGFKPLPHARSTHVKLTQSQTQVSFFTFPLEVSKPFFALSSPHGTVGLLQLPDDSLEWFQGTAANGKLDISRRLKTSLASYGGLSQGMVQVRTLQAYFVQLFHHK